MIRIFDTLQSRSLSSLCDRANIREKFLFTYIKEQEYGPFTIERYLLSLIHFYDFVICKEIEIDWVSSEEILPMKVIINTLFILFIQYRESKHVCILNQKKPAGMLCWNSVIWSAFKKMGFLYFERQTGTEIISASLYLYIDI